MSRFKIALGLVVLAGAVGLIAIALRPSEPRDTERALMEQRHAEESQAVRQQKSSAQSAANDAMLGNFAKLAGESDRGETNAPRAQSKQIKMH